MPVGTESRDARSAGIAGEDTCVGLINLSRNFGHHMALTAGLDHARGDVVVCVDGDGLPKQTRK